MPKCDIPACSRFGMPIRQGKHSTPHSTGMHYYCGGQMLSGNYFAVLSDLMILIKDADKNKDYNRLSHILYRAAEQTDLIIREFADNDNIKEPDNSYSSITHKQINTVEDLYEVLKEEITEIVQHIESSPKTTKDHYGKYMGAIAMLNKSRIKKSVAAELLILGGANSNGVKSALMLS